MKQPTGEHMLEQIFYGCIQNEDSAGRNALKQLKYKLSVNEALTVIHTYLASVTESYSTCIEVESEIGNSEYLAAEYAGLKSLTKEVYRYIKTHTDLIDKVIEEKMREREKIMTRLRDLDSDIMALKK